MPTKKINIVDNEDQDDDVPFLSPEALKALQEFYEENRESEEILEENWVKFK